MTEQQEWRIGELARATRVTVRALHHYDRLGLLVPSSRTAGGHRCYTGDDVRRLHTILALRGFGLPLRDIAAALAAGGEDPREILRRQLAETEERIRQAQQVRISLLGLLSRLDRPEPSQFVTLIEEMVTMSQPLTPEQIEEMNRTRREWASQLSEEELAEMSRKRAEARAAMTDEQLADMQRTRARLMGATE
ncbi:MerR family transcriptional regulator [Actinoplanes sp. KI2]|uniref:MerR family transcriptional regulator n=1 Tax=Actinoplanes sp. KI2 TaxID=2983315 RepID=UPI0021D5F65F|nr:MerR family transcriptional regulator [Actinoplanes sp. KI2]MCU7727663.1 MerR family transcriptional regulator [Actinoplanes sp. KI2]